MATRILVIEGPDASGHSTHTDLLALSLRASGVDALAFHHKRPSLGDPFRDALAYAEQRQALLASKPGAVIVADRWRQSTLTEGMARDLPSLIKFAEAERYALPEPTLLVVLTAPAEVLDARFAARGDDVTALDQCRRLAYRDLFANPAIAKVDTSQPTPDVTRALLRLSLKALGVEVSL